MATPLTRRRVLGGLAGAFAFPGAARAEGILAAKEYFETARVELLVPGLHPSHDGITIAQLSDLHVGAGVPSGRILAAVRALNDERPDLAVLTGDFVTTRLDPVAMVPEVLKGITAPTFAVLGNHDHRTDAPGITEKLEGIGYAVLQNQHSCVYLRGAPFTVLGMDDSTTRNHDPEATFKGAPRDGSRLVLTHTPTGAKALPPNENLVVLSGHTHGGQVHIPKLTEGLFARAGQPYVRGLHEVNGNQLYVNRGMGFGKGSPFPRLNSDPELTILTLRAAL
ncbi:MAG: metallophosphoesterase [Myxococcaceae bacterium]|nr:metallophosphoesterase [Myxococcaceae bacterium]